LTDNRYIVDAETGCWVWQLVLNENGYPHSYQHRRFYEQVHGPQPKGRHIHHVCRNRACVNPEHLQSLTPTEHAQIHRVEKHVITVEEAREIRELCRDPTLTFQAIGDRYGISFTHVEDIAFARRWKEELGTEPVRPEGKVCKACGKSIGPEKNRHALYCGQTCRQRGFAQRQGREQRRHLWKDQGRP
jgi:hypothetical protein